MRPVIVLVLSPARLVMVDVLDLDQAPPDVYAWLSVHPCASGGVTEGEPGERMFCTAVGVC